MKIWSTKYALTKGILEHDAQECSDGMVRILAEHSLHPVAYLHGEGKDWHRTFESAQQRAEDMRVAKVASLRKSIKQLEAMRFGSEV